MIAVHAAPRYTADARATERLSAAMGANLIAATECCGETILSVASDAIEDVLRLLRDEHDYQQLVEIAGVDYPDRAERFEVVYMLLSLTKNHRIMVKIAAAEHTPVPTVTTLWPVAGWLEREVYDMFGVVFAGNPDLRRILTDYGFEGHPFRKDFPLTGYVELRYSEDDKRVVYEPVELAQDLRQFDFLSPWEGARYLLPGDEKAQGEAPGAPTPVSADPPAAKPAAPPKTAVETKTTDHPGQTGGGAGADGPASRRVGDAPGAPKVVKDQPEPMDPKPGDTPSRPTGGGSL